MVQRSFWEDIFGQLQPQYPDQSIGYGPTGERESLLTNVVGTMWEDPIALSGFRSDVFDWDAGADPNLGEYRMLRDPVAPDTIRLARGGPRGVPPVGPTTQFTEYGPISRMQPQMTPITYDRPLTGQRLFNPVVRHEARHRGMEHLPAAARAYNIPFRDVAPNLRMSEQANVYEDRQLGHTESYAGMINFTPWEMQMYGDLLRHLRATADQVNAARVQQLNANPGMTWSQLR